MVRVTIKIVSETTDPRRGQFRSHYKRILPIETVPRLIGSSMDTFSHEQTVDLAAGKYSVVYTIAPETMDWMTKIYIDGVLKAQGMTPIAAEFEVAPPVPPEMGLSLTFGLIPILCVLTVMVVTEVSKVASYGYGR